jgi:hypothetical protein
VLAQVARARVALRHGGVRLLEQHRDRLARRCRCARSPPPRRLERTL